MWASTWKDDPHFSLFVGLLVGFFRFSEGGTAGRMIEIGGVPSDSGERSSLTDKAFFLKVGQETLDDTRVGVMGSRLWEVAFGFVDGPALALFPDGTRAGWFDGVGELLNEDLEGTWPGPLESELITRRKWNYTHVPARSPAIFVFFPRRLFWLGSESAVLRFLLELSSSMMELLHAACSGNWSNYHWPWAPTSTAGKNLPSSTEHDGNGENTPWNCGIWCAVLLWRNQGDITLTLSFTLSSSSRFLHSYLFTIAFDIHKPSELRAPDFQI